MKRRILALIAAVLIVCGTSLTVFAITPDELQSGTMKLTTSPNGEVTIYRVGDLEEDDGNYSFVLIGAYAESDAKLDDIQAPELAAKLAETAKHDKSGIKKTADAEGKLTFDVEAGLYLFVQTKAGKDGKLFNPFLISMPNCEDGVYTNEVDATPKISIAPDEQETSKPTTKPGVSPGGSTGGRLPQTGQLNWPVPLLACSGLLLFIVGIGLRRGKETQ